MQEKKSWLGLMVLSTLFLVGSLCPASAQDITGKKVLIIHSYHAEYPWVDSIQKGIDKILDGTGVVKEVFYMDTKRNNKELDKKIAAKKAVAKITSFAPDVIITSDDNAQSYLTVKFLGAGNPNFVFCGVNAKPEKYGYPAANVTGILERPHFQQSIDLGKSLIPTIQKVAVISDNSPTSMATLDYMKSQKASGFEIVSWTTPTTFVEWKTAVETAQSAADAIAIFTYHTVKSTTTNKPMVPKAVMGWTVNNSKLPVIGFLPFAVDDGALCAFAESGAEHGSSAATIAKHLLEGKSTKDYPMTTAKNGMTLVNAKTAAKFNITVNESNFDKVAEK